MAATNNAALYDLLPYFVVFGAVCLATMQSAAQTFSIPPQLTITQGYHRSFTYTAVGSRTDFYGVPYDVNVSASGSLVFPFVNSNSGLGAVYKGSINESAS